MIVGRSRFNGPKVLGDRVVRLRNDDGFTDAQMTETFVDGPRIAGCLRNNKSSRFSLVEHRWGSARPAWRIVQLIIYRVPCRSHPFTDHERRFSIKPTILSITKR